MKALTGAVALGVFLTIPLEADGSPECLKSAASVRQRYGYGNGKGWPSWTLRMPGHIHEKCWFPKDSKFILAKAKPSRVAQPVERRPLALPKLVKKQQIYEQPTTIFQYDDETWDALTALGSPQQRINATFHFLGIK